MLRSRSKPSLHSPVSSQDSVALRQRSLQKSTQTWSFSSAAGFELRDLKSWRSLVNLLYRPCDPSSLAVFRIAFGMLMLLDLPQERGWPYADLRWGQPTDCRFPLFDFIHHLPIEWMYVVYFIMMLGAIGITLGLFYRLSAFTFVCLYWYIFLLDKTAWNNHSYLFGLLAFLLVFVEADKVWSIDSWRNKSKGPNPVVPLWNYAILRSQLFLVYFIAGLKKLDIDWLTGHSVTNLSEHWTFEPLRLFLSDHDIDLYIVHFGGFALDISIGFLLYFNPTRPLAFFFGGMFHFMNSQIFSIGMFPYMMLATMPLFSEFDWPRKLLERFASKKTHSFRTKEYRHLPKHPHLTSALVLVYIGLQCFLPYSHWITKGYNNWTSGLYGYSWDMMIHSWHTLHVRITVIDKSSGETHYIDPQKWTQSDRWVSHADMIKQYARCAQHNLQTFGLTNISLYVDVWRSLNGRYQQRLFDPNVDIITAPWSPFEPVSWTLRLLIELSDWRTKLNEIQNNLLPLSKHLDMMFVADFPGMTLENYVSEDFGNTSLEILHGEVRLELPRKRNITLIPGNKVPAGEFHMVHTTSPHPSCYTYVYINTTAVKLEQQPQGVAHTLDPWADTTPKFRDDSFWKVKYALIERSFSKTSEAICSLLTGTKMNFTM